VSATTELDVGDDGLLFIRHLVLSVWETARARARDGFHPFASRPALLSRCHPATQGWPMCDKKFASIARKKIARDGA
jgi:hypothetical protein